MVEASTSMRIFSSMVTETPMRPSNSIIVVTSCKCGTLETVTGPSASKQPAKIGSVAFLAPEMRISPSSAMPPWICNLSTCLPCVLVRRIDLQRQRMDLAAHRFSQGGIHQLVSLHRPLAGKCGRNHHGLEVHIVLAFPHRLSAGQARLDQLRYLLWIHTDTSNIAQAYASGCEILHPLYHSGDASRLHRRRSRRPRPPGAQRRNRRIARAAAASGDGFCTRLPHL